MQVGVQGDNALEVDTDGGIGLNLLGSFKDGRGGAAHECGGGEADALAGLQILLALGPVHVLLGVVNALLQSAAGDHQTGGGAVAGLQSVAAADLQRIDAQGLGGAVHSDLVGELNLAGGVAAHCAVDGLVGVNTLTLEVDAVDLVGEGGPQGAELNGGDHALAVSAAVQIVAGLLGLNDAFFIEGSLDVHNKGVAAVLGDKLLFTGQHEADGTAGALGHDAGAEVMGSAVVLAAEGAAAVGADDMDMGLVHTQNVGQPVQVCPGAGGDGVDGVLILDGIVGGVAAVRLDTGVNRLVGGVVTDLHIVGGGELLVKVLAVDGALGEAGVAHVGGQLAAYLGGVFLGGFYGIVTAGQGLVLHLDQLHCLLGDGFAGGAHGGNQLAVVAGLVQTDDLLVTVVSHVGVHVSALAVTAVTDGTEVLTGQNALDAGQSLSFAGVDGQHLGVGVGAVLGLAVEHIGGVIVAAVLGAAGHLFVCFHVDVLAFLFADQTIIFRLAEIILICVFVHYRLPP